jgi:hypothetical protein
VVVEEAETWALTWALASKVACVASRESSWAKREEDEEAV